MPKLEGIESKTMFGYQVDKENNDVIYSDGPHVYLSKEDGSRYISVTTLIGEYENKFNEAFFSKYKALEALADPDHFSIIKQGLLNTQIWKPELISKLKIDETEFENKVQEILDGWHSTRDEACEHGTWVHSLAETSFYGKTDFDLSTFGCPNLVGKYSCKQGYYPKKLEDGIYPEYLVSWVSPEGLKISGQVDLLVRDGNDLFIFDYKTNKEIKKKSYYNSSKKKNVMMKYPLSHLMDCNFYHYTLQLSLYAYMIQQINPELDVKSLKLIHIDREGKQTVYEVEYLKKEVETMIKHYAKQLKMSEALDRDKPYII